MHGLQQPVPLTGRNEHHCLIAGALDPHGFEGGNHLVHNSGKVIARFGVGDGNHGGIIP